MSCFLFFIFCQPSGVREEQSYRFCWFWKKLLFSVTLLLIKLKVHINRQGAWLAPGKTRRLAVLVRSHQTAVTERSTSGNHHLNLSQFFLLEYVQQRTDGEGSGERTHGTFWYSYQEKKHWRDFILQKIITIQRLNTLVELNVIFPKLTRSDTFSRKYIAQNFERKKELREHLKGPGGPLDCAVPSLLR